MTMALAVSVGVFANVRQNGNAVASGSLSLNVVEQNVEFKYVKDVRLYIFNANTSQYVYLQTEKLYQNPRGQLFVTYCGRLVSFMDTNYSVKPLFQYCFFWVMGTMCYFNI